MTSVLFDAPGPKTRRRHLIYSLIGGLALLGILFWVYSTLAEQGIFDGDRWDIFGESTAVWEAIGRGVWATLRTAALAGVLAGLLGAALTALRLSGKSWLVWPARIFVELFRGLPVLLLMYFPFVIWTTIEPFQAVVIGLTLYNGAIISEILRSGVVALPKGQTEAGLAIGLTKTATLRAIELPQAVRIMLPTLVSQFVVLLKDTSLGYIVTYPELLRTVQLLQNFYGSKYLFSFFFVAAGVYIVINMTFSQFAAWLARRGNRKASRAPQDRADLTAGGGVGGA